MFLREVVGTDGHFTVDEISEQLRNLIVTRFGTILAGAGIPVLDLAASTEKLGQFVTGRIAPEFVNYGLELTTLLVENISLPTEVEQALDRRSSMGRVGDLARYTQFQAAEAMRAAAANPGAAGAGIGVMVGTALGAQVGPWGATPPSVAPPPLPQEKAWHIAIDNKPAGPFAADEIARRAKSGALGAGTLVWAKGMPTWLAAGQVAELEHLFAVIPPPLPGAS